MRTWLGSMGGLVLVTGLLSCSDDGVAGGGTEGATGVVVTASGTAGSGGGETEETGVATGAADSTGVEPTGGGDVTGGSGYDCEPGSAQCNDGMDNDGDGLVDAEDPECTGPCDEDESSFQTGIPGDNMDCKQDCFFDGNSGQGNDGCIWDLRCDPANPGAELGCEYDPDKCDEPQVQDPMCFEVCQGLVPNGCDCFGCCEVTAPDGSTVNIFLNSGPDCSLANLDACAECTPSTDCGNDCNPEACELCFGESELPPECEEPECPTGQQACVELFECPAGFYCLTGCCVPYDPEA